jgi:hypothetical protein
MKRRRQRPTATEMAERCNDWNIDFPIGTHVLYHSVIGEGVGVPTRTRSVAYVLSGHTPVIFVEGIAGCVALDALTFARPEAR